MKIKWSLPALRDLDRTQEYIEEHSPSGAERVWVRIHDRVALQAEIPLAAPLYRGGPAWMLVVSGTPYLVFYVVA